MRFRIVHKPWEDHPFMLQGVWDGREGYTHNVYANSILGAPWFDLRDFKTEAEARSCYDQCISRPHVLIESPENPQ